MCDDFYFPSFRKHVNQFVSAVEQNWHRVGIFSVPVQLYYKANFITDGFEI